jgi:3-oxoacyl-[acyl-carrier protein] reductase
MNLKFNDKTVLITGATRGIGKQIAQDFQKLGAQLILTGTNIDEINKLNEEHKKSDDKKIQYYCVDFSKDDSLTAFIKDLGKHKRIDVCINNAGINRINSITDTKLTDWKDIMDVNIKAPFIILREVGNKMKTNRYGRIVNIASIYGVISKEKRAIYSSSKFGLIGLTKSISIELAPHNILANCVSPGFVLTDLTKKILNENEMKELENKIPMGRLAVPEDISRVVLFLSSDLNTYITGQNLIVDGGYVSI